MTEPIRRSMKDLTGGAELHECPWHALHDPLVVRVLNAMPFFESGQLGFHAPLPSHRLVTGIRHYHSVSNRIYCRQLELERLDRERAARPPAALPMRGARRV